MTRSFAILTVAALLLLLGVTSALRSQARGREIRLEIAPPPPRPIVRVNHVSTVVFEVQVDKEGKVASDKLITGEEALVEPSRFTFKDWTFRELSKEPRLTNISATFVYKPKPDLPKLPAAFDFPLPEGQCTDLRVPFPLKVEDPGYPVGGMGDGGVVLQADLNAEGKPENIHVVWGAEDLQASSVAAVSEWKFLVPNQTADSRNIAVIVFYFQRPRYS